MQPIPSSTFSAKILVDAGCIILHSRSANLPQRGRIVVASFLLGLGRYIPLGDPHRILQFHTRHSSQSNNNRRNSSLLSRVPSVVRISSVPCGDLKPVHRRRISCRRNNWCTWSTIRGSRSASVPMALKAHFPGSFLALASEVAVSKPADFAAVAFVDMD